MTNPTCPECGRPLHPVTATICDHCRHTLEIAIVNIGYYRADLTTLRTGQARYGRGAMTATRGDSHLGMDTRFGPTMRDGHSKPGPGTSIAAEARAVVLGWVAYIAGHVTLDGVAGPVCGCPCLHTSCNRIRRQRSPADSVTAACRFLIWWSDWLRKSPEGLVALRQLVSIERRLARIVDRPPDEWFRGMCSRVLEDGSLCPQNLYAKTEHGDVKCPGCGMVWNGQLRKDWMLAEAEDYLLTATECARIIGTLGDHEGSTSRLTGRIYKWAQRGRLLASGHVEVDARLRPTYRLGAVLDLLAEDLRVDERTRRVSA